MSFDNKDCFKPPANGLQKLQIEQLRYNFLLNCRHLKRPPSSLRVSGCGSLEDNKRIQLLSELETKTLATAIETKLNEII